jgi:hypothetical protein
MAPFPPVMVYDEAAERTVVFGDGRLAAYDATADRWENLNGSDDPDQGLPWFGRSSQLGLDTYDPVNERLVGRGGGDGLWAFEPATRQWTFLLEARDGVTVPTDDASGQVASPRPGWAPELEALFPSDVNGVTFTKTSGAGRPRPNALRSPPCVAGACGPVDSGASSEHEANPRPCIALGMPSSRPNGPQHIAVRLRVPPEVLLHAAEVG